MVKWGRRSMGVDGSGGRLGGHGHWGMSGDGGANAFCLPRATMLIDTYNVLSAHHFHGSMNIICIE